MKIYNIQTYKKINNKKNTNFKAYNISNITLKRLEVVKNNPKNNELFIKLASLLGLTTILSWVKSLSEKNNNEELSKLDVIDTTWAQKNNSLLLENETRDEFLNILSKVDETESVLWTKALLSQENSEIKNEITPPNNQAIELFLSKDSNETFMKVSANKAIDRILMQINALESVDEAARNSHIKDIENKLQQVIKQANTIQEDTKTSEIYSKLANITKIFAIFNIINNNSTNKIVDLKLKDIQKTNNEENISKETITQEIAQPETSEEPFTKETTTKINTIQVESASVTDSSEKVQIPESMKPSLNIIGKINLKDDGISRFKSGEIKKTPPVLNKSVGEIVITEENKEFIEGIFLKAFKKTSQIQPETYSSHIDFIKMIYDSYSDEKDLLKKNLLIKMSEYDLRGFIDKYFTLTKGKIEKFDFLNFMKLEEFKRANNGEITQKDFDFINESRNEIIKYFTLINDRTEVAFNIGVSAEKRLQFINDFHKIVYNIDSNKLFHDINPGKIDVNDIINELSYKLAQDTYQYPNIVRYLSIDLDELPESANDENNIINTDEKIPEELEDTIEYIKGILCNTKYRARIKDLAEILNNESFDGIMNSTHAKMRFIERFVFHESRLLSKKTPEIKLKTNLKIDKLKKTLEGYERIKFRNYPTKDNAKKTQKFGPRISIKDYTIGLNEKALIHTIWDE